MSQNNKDNLLDVLRTIFRWKKAILYLCLAAGIVAAIVVLVVPVYYQASTVFFVASPDQSTPELIFGNSLSEPELYGDESDIDRLLTIAEGNELVEFLIDSFQLYEHYDIDRNNAKAPYNIKLKFFSLYDVQKTKRDAIQLSIEDRDPEIAAQITRAARSKINKIAQNLVRGAQGKKISAYQSSIQQKEGLLRSIGDSLLLLRKRYGIFNTLAQSEFLTTEYTTAEARLAFTRARLDTMKTFNGIRRDSLVKLSSQVAGLEKQVESLSKSLEDFNEGVAEVDAFTDQYNEASQALSEEKEKLKQYQAAYNANIPALILVEEAELPIIKSRPKRTLIVLAAVAVAFFFGIIGVLLFDNYQDINWREVYHGR
ncbi:MAG: Wzz/FepE/Etk N-terminal domain-containing protein [Saprospiraceae bacterium]